MSLRTSGASRSESNEMIAVGNHTLILRTLVWQSHGYSGKLWGLPRRPCGAPRNDSGFEEVRSFCFGNCCK